MTERWKSTPEDDRVVLDERAPPDERHRSVIKVAADRLFQFEPPITKMLYSDEPWLQVAGMEALIARWQRDEHLDRGYDLLRTSPSSLVRLAAVSALKMFLSDYPDKARRSALAERIVRAWARQAVEDEDRVVREACDSAIVGEVAPERYVPRFRLPNDFDPLLHADWSILGPLLEPDQVPPHDRPPAPASTPEDEALLAEQSAPAEARVAALRRLVGDGRYDLEDQVEELLVHPDPVLRGAAMVELARTWRRWERTEDLWDMLHLDPGWQARAAAAEAIGDYVAATGAFRQSHLEHLARAVLEDDDPRVQRAAWAQLLALVGDERPVPEDFYPERDVDLAVLEPYLPSP